MSKGEATRQKMLEQCAILLQSQGYHGTGVRQILDESNTPRGSFYFHFPDGKEQMAAEAAHESGAAWQTLLTDAVERAETLQDALDVVFDELGDRLEASNWQLGCPVATLALEMGPYSETIRTSCEDTYQEWERIIGALLGRWQVSEELRPDLALFVLSSIEGALLLARTYQSRRPMDVVKQTLLGMTALLIP